MRWFLGLTLVIVVAIIGVLVMPAPIDPVSWTPDPDPGLTGPFAPNDELAKAELLLEGDVIGPEDIACAESGTLYTGLDDGRIIEISVDGSHREIANTGGRPLGMELDSAGRLIVVDARRGLLAVSMDGTVEVLADTVNGTRIVFADDLDIAADGIIWFSDASMDWGFQEEIYNFLEGRPTGRLLSYNPVNGETSVRMESLFFANGVAVGPEDEYVLVNETATGRIHRLWLRGEKAGQRDLFVSSLPGTPDNISFNGSDTFWVALPGLRASLDANAQQPLVRKLVSHFPEDVLRGISKPYPFVVGLGLDGEVKRNLQNTGEGYNMITSATECNGSLYLGSLSLPALARYPL